MLASAFPAAASMDNEKMITTFLAASMDQAKAHTILIAASMDKKKMLAARLAANIYAIVYTSTLLHRLFNGGGCRDGGYLFIYSVGVVPYALEKHLEK